MSELKSQLKKVFGYDQFRGNQEEIINNVLDGNNTFVIMPTGAGKSICYQLPALMMEGTAVVISPLIALMKNQVDQMRAVGVDARVLNSTLSKTETRKTKEAVLAKECKLLYIAPETLTKPENLEFLRKATLSFFAIDEAHCISEWGHDFRPEYRRIKDVVGEIGDGELPIIALTATATPKVQLDIQKNLNMDAATVFKSSFNRTNLFYEVRPKSGAKKQLIKFVQTKKGQSGIVYCLSRKKVEEIAELLRVNGCKAVPYHAGLDAGTRARNQDGFLNDDIDIVVATIAFGMGIDKPDVRFVVHYNVPKSLEGYYQETGRAGRDGLEGHCLLFYSYNDLLKLEKFNKDKPVTERENSKVLLDEIGFYSESAVCRRTQLLHYFGEKYDSDACTKDKMCDNCKHPKASFDGKEDVLHALQAVSQTEERFGMTQLVSVLRGSENAYVKSYNHDKLEIYGKGKSSTDAHWKSVLRQTLMAGLILKDIEQVGILKLSDAGRAFIEKPTKITLFEDHDYSNLGLEEESEQVAVSTRTFDEELFFILKALRKTVATEKSLPPYVIFHDPSLQEMATLYPTTEDELVNITGVGQGKAKKFGRDFLLAIREYTEEKGIDTLADIAIKSKAVNSKSKVLLIQQIDRKVDLEEIAQNNGMTYESIMEEIENICYSGTKLDLDYYIESFLEEDDQEEIMEYFLEAETDDITVAVEEFEDAYSEEELRLMRVKFLSIYGN